MICHARATCIAIDLCIRHLERPIHALYGFDGRGVERLVGDEVVNLGRRGGFNWRVGYADVAVLFPHGEGGVRDVPGAGEEGEGWWGEGWRWRGGGEGGGVAEGDHFGGGIAGGAMSWMCESSYAAIVYVMRF